MNREACPVCGGNGYVSVVADPRGKRRRTPTKGARAATSAPVTAAPKLGLARPIAELFRQTLLDANEAALPERGRLILRHEVGRLFEEARLAWNGLYPEPPLSNLGNIACELGAFADFQIADRGRSMANVVHDAILDQFTECRAAGLLASAEGRVKVGRLLATLASSLQTIGLRTNKLWGMADILGGAQ